MKLKDKVAVVTGGGSGIGAASAIAMAAEGARVLVVDLNETGAKTTVAVIERERGTALAVAADVTRAADNQAHDRSVQAWLAEHKGALGAVAAAGAGAVVTGLLSLRR